MYVWASSNQICFCQTNMDKLSGLLINWTTNIIAWIILHNHVIFQVRFSWKSSPRLIWISAFKELVQQGADLMGSSAFIESHIHPAVDVHWRSHQIYISMSHVTGRISLELLPKCLPFMCHANSTWRPNVLPHHNLIEWPDWVQILGFGRLSRNGGCFCSLFQNGGKFCPCRYCPVYQKLRDSGKKRLMKANKVQGVQMKHQTCSSFSWVVSPVSQGSHPHRPSPADLSITRVAEKLTRWRSCRAFKKTKGIEISWYIVKSWRLIVDYFIAMNSSPINRNQ